MPQQTISSQSDASSLHYHRCWWAWCRHNYYTKQELFNHVISEHVQKARPVRLRDIHALQIAEDSYWSSLDFGSLPALPSSLLDKGENCTHTSSHHQGVSHEPAASSIHLYGFKLVDVPSSLPSPVPLPQDPVSPILRQPPTDLFVDEFLEVASASSPQSSNHLTPLSKRGISGTPTFVSLSSRPGSPNKVSYDVPDSPCFDLLVMEATRWPKYPVPESEDLNDVVLEDSSQVHVLNQPTQRIDGKERNQELESRSSDKVNLVDLESDDAALQLEPHSSSSYNQDSSPPPNFRNSPSSFYSLVNPSTIPVARQSWYQPQRRRPKKHSASNASVGCSSPVTSPLTKATTRITAPVPVNSVPVQGTNSMVSQMFQPTPETQSQSQDKSSDSSQLSSYPLVTQAPLRSQSLTQD